MSQVKAKKKLHYYQGHEIVNSEFKVNEILSLRDIDNIFDDIDADSELGLPLLSPLPKSACVNGQKESGSSPDVEKMTTSSKPVSKDALIQENGIEEDDITDKENPLNGIAPIKTSSPIALETEGNETVDGLRPMADPLLFGVEDEEPIGGDLSKPSSTQQSEPIKGSLGDSTSLESPPERLDFRKTTKSNAGPLSSMKTAKNTETSTQATPPEIMDEESSQLPSVSVQESEPKLQTEQCKSQVVENAGKGLSFQHKLKKALMLKSPSSRKQTSVPAARPPVDLEEDFMFLEDEAPVLFRIPRKAETSRNKRPIPADSAKENVLTDEGSTHQLSQSKVDVTNPKEADAKRKQSEIETGKQKPKGKRGKASKKSGKDSVTHDDVENEADPVTDVLEDRVCENLSPQTVQQHKATSAGKKRAKRKAPDPVELCDKDEINTDGRQEIPVPESRTPKKSSKSTKQERRGSNAKKESSKVTAAADLHPTNTVKSNKNRKNSKKENVVSKTKKQTSNQQIQLEQEHPACDEQENEKEKEQRTVNKQSSKKKVAVDPGKKQKRKDTKNVEPTPTDPPTVASDISSDSPLCLKRKRKPPGDWWLTSPNESTTDIQPQQASDTIQKQKARTKTPMKKAAVDSESLRPAQGNRKKKNTQNVLDNTKPLTAGASGHDSEAEKKTGGRRKSKGASPAHVSGEGACTNENDLENSLEFCSANRKHSVLTGEKRVFDCVYSRDAGSAKKQPSSSDRRPEISEPDNGPQKRQRKAPSHWWEAPQSHEPANEIPPPASPPPQKSKRTPNKVSNTPLCGALNKDGNSLKSQKKKNQARNMKRNNVNTPKSIKRSLASMNAIYTSGKSEKVMKSGQRCKKQGRRNLLHSLEDQSDHSSENMPQSDDQLQGVARTSFGFTSGVTEESTATRNGKSVRISSGPNTLSDVDVAFRSGPSSMLDLQRHEEEEEDVELPSSRVTAQVRQAPRVFEHCDLCGPPLQPVVLEDEDWNNLHAWFSHLWPPASKNGQVISPDDFHWHSHGGRAMGHMVDLQSQSFSHGKILLGSFMKKPPQVELDTVSVFSVISSCVRVDIEGVKSVHNSGQVFMIPSGQMYTIHNLCQEPAVLIYHRTQCSDI